MANKNVTKKALAEKDAEIKKNMEILGISREEAEEMWAFDHDEIDCEEVDAIEDKIKETQKSDKKKTGSPLDKVRNMKAKKKADAEKHNIIQSVFSFLKTLGELVESFRRRKCLLLRCLSRVLMVDITLSLLLSTRVAPMVIKSLNTKEGK